MSEKPRARSRKKKPFPIKTVVIAAVIAAAAAGISAGYYIQRARQYETVFFPCTVINGIDASHKTIEEVKNLISAEVDHYVLTIQERGGTTEQIKKEDIDLQAVFDGSLEEYLAVQNPMDWWKPQNKVTEYEIAAMITYDQKKLSDKIDSLAIFDEEKIEKPQDAYLSDYISGQGYVIVPEEPGNEAEKSVVEEAIAEAVINLKPELSLEDIDAYKKPAITSEDEKLNGMAQRLNRYVNMTVTYRFGEKREVLNGDTIVNWLTIGDDDQVAIDKDEVAAYVKSLASQYNTAYKSKNLKTSYGSTVTISKGFYGWRINQSQETEELYQILLSGESQEREPIYLQTAASHGENDYGNTYVEINLTAQHLYFYKDGKLIVESDFVSGNQAKGYDTPSGAYPLTYKQRNATLKGEGYATPVSYWMPFNGNIGMHDASWRSSFGGSIYKTNGSHGCINLPASVAKTIYENIEAGMPVLCYHLDGTGSTVSSSAGGTKTETTTAAETAAETTAAETTAETAAETAAAETTAAGQSQGPGATEGASAGNTSAGPGESGPGGSGSSGGGGAAGPGESGPGGSGSGNGGAAGPGESGPGESGPGGSGSGGAAGSGESGPGGSGSGNSGAAGPGGSESDEGQGAFDGDVIIGSEPGNGA